ncbi:MAG: HAD-IA family hydrolase [Ruminococcus sp.]|nr:HAD-IA family hydrolase [Ruminococcus sp.]
MSRYKAYIFDFDLTLADSSKGILICFRHTLGTFGYPVPDDMTIYRTIGIPLTDAFDVLTGMEENPNKEQMRQVYVEKANEVMSKYTFFYEDTIAILQTLVNAGVKIGIVSSKMRYRIVESFEMQTHCHPYDLILGLDDVDRPKPDPQGILRCAELLGVAKEEVLYIGDSYIDAETARNAGVDFAGVTTGSTTKEDFEKYPSVYVGSSLLEIFRNI